MFRSLSSKNRHGSSGTASSRKKTESTSRRRAETVASSSSHRKQSRYDEGSESRGKNPPPSLSAYQSVDGSSNPSSYYTASDLYDRRPQSLTENAIRTLGMQEEAWEDDEPRVKAPSEGPSKKGKKHHSSSSSREHVAHKDKRTIVDEPLISDRSLNSHFPEQFPQSTPQYQTNPYPMSSHVQDQFPGQDPLAYSAPAFTQENGVGRGLAADYYSGQNLPSSTTQPGPRPEHGSPGYGVTDSAVPSPLDAPGNNSAAEYYSGTPLHSSMPPSVHQEPSQSSTTTGLKPSKSDKPTKSSKPTKSGKSPSSSSAIPTATAATLGYDASNFYQSSASFDQQQSTSTPYDQHMPNVSMSGHATPQNSYHNHSHSLPPMSTSVEYYAPPPSSRPSKTGKQPSHTNDSLYTASAAGMAAGAYAFNNHNKYHHPSTHNHSASLGILDSKPPHNHMSPSPYMNGNMAMKHQHKGPISKFVDWWKDHEDVRKMEEYTEYIGVCKYCFDPRSSVVEAPRKHHYGGRRSMDSQGRRSSESLRRSYAHSSKVGRVDKDTRYYSSDSERRRKKSSWLGAGLAGYGLAKMGKSLWQNSRDFDDTYSVKSGRRDDVSRTISRKHETRSRSPDRMSRSEKGVLQNDSSKSSYTRSKTGTASQHQTFTERSRSSSRSRKTGPFKAAAGASISASGIRMGSSPIDEQIHVRHPSTSPERSSIGATVRRRGGTGFKAQSPSLGEIFGLTSSKKRQSSIPLRDPSRSSTSPRKSVHGSLFSNQHDQSRKAHRKKNSFFTFANSSSSSNNSDLAFGNGYNRSDLSYRKASRKQSDQKLNATLLGIGATAAAIAAAQKGSKYARRRPEVLAVRERRDKKARRDHRTPYSKQSSNGDDAWESASEDDAGSVSSGLAFGDFDVRGKSPARRTSSESITSQSSGTNKWSWRWRNTPDKKRSSVTPPPAYPPRPGYVDPNVFGRPSGDDNPGLYSQSMSGESVGGTTGIESYPAPLQYIQPMPVADSPQLGVVSTQAMPGAFPEHPSVFKSRPDPIPLQQPQPVNHVQPSVFASEDSSQLPNADRYGSNEFTRPQPPTGLRRTQSSPITSHIVRDVAIAGLASAATAGILSSGKNRSFKEESPSGVRFDLTEKQAKKEERERRKEEVKESKERRKTDDVKETRERRRADRERALKEEAERQAVESREREKELAQRRALDRKLTEEADALSRREATERAREQEADIRRQKEIEHYMRDALAAQARDAERRQREEAHQPFQQPIQQQQDPRTPWDWGHADYGIDIARRQKELDDRERDHNVSDVWGPSVAGGVSGAAIGAVLDDIRQEDRCDHDAASSYKTQSFEPSNEHNGRPMMDDDLHDPGFFLRNRSPSDLENHERIARNAAAKVISDLEDRYRDPTPSQSEFFAPEELSMPSKGKTKVHDPDGGNDVQVYRVSEIEHTNEPPPPYQPSPDFPGLRDDKGDQSRWGIPKLNVIAPTPPASHAGSVKGDKSPVIATYAGHSDVKDNSDASTERRRANRVSWGEDQTRVYEVQTPESSQEHFDPHREPRHGHSALRNEIVDNAPSSEESSPSNYTTDRPQSSRNVNEFVDEITREQPNMNPGGFYQYPFVESVSDLGFVLDSPGTEGAPPVKGYVEGEIDGPTPMEYQIPHVPGGFDDEEIDSPLPTNDGTPDKARSTDGSYFGLQMAAESGKRNVDASAEAKADTHSSKKEKRKQDKAARRGLGDETVSPPSTAPEVIPEPDDEFQWPLSKKEQKKRAKAAKRALSDFDATQSSDLTKDALETRSVFSEPAKTDDVTSKTERRKHKTEKYDPTTPSPGANVSVDDLQSTHSAEPAELDQGDYFVSKKERRKRDKAAKRASLGEKIPVSTPLDYGGRNTQNSVENEDWSNQIEKAEARIPLDRGLAEETEQSSTKERQEGQVGDIERSGYRDNVTATLASVVTAAPLITERRQSPIRRKSEPQEIESRRDTSPASTSRNSGSKSTPTSPTENRRPSIPGHAFDDLDMTSSSKRPKAKRNSIFNSPTVGSPLRSAMTWEDYVGPIEISPTEERKDTRDSKELEATEGAEHLGLEKSFSGLHSEEDRSFSRSDFPSPESERGAPSVASAPTEQNESDRRHESRHSRHGDDEREPRRSRSVAASEPADLFESSRRHKRKSHRDSGDFDDTASVASARSYSSKHDDEESSKSKKKGGILSLFRRKSVDSAPRVEDVKDNDEEDKHKKRHHRRRSSERGLDDGDRRSSTSRSRRHDGEDFDDTRSQHSSSSRTRRRHHRDGSVDDDALSQASESRPRRKHRQKEQDPLREDGFDDSYSVTSESKRKHKHRHRDCSTERQRSPSKESKSRREDDKDAKERDQSFLEMRVEDEESRPLPADATLPPSQAPESVESFNISSLSPVPESSRAAEPRQASDPKNTPEEPTELDQDIHKDQVDVGAPHETLPVSTEDTSSPPYSPTLEGSTPRRIPLRVNSSTSVPLRFRYPPTSPGVQHERSSSFSSPVASSPSSPITPRSRHNRPGSTEFTSSTEFRPLYLLESTRKPQESDKEEPLPSLPSSRTTSRASSLPSSDEWQSAAEEIEPSEQGDPESPADVDLSHELSEDVLDSQQTTPKATEFPPNVLDVQPRAEPEYYSWSDIEREERMHEEEAKQHHSETGHDEEPVSQRDPEALLERQTEGSTEALNNADQSANNTTGNLAATALTAVTGATVGWLATMVPESGESAESLSDSNVQEEAPTNHDPLASDVWGELSDNAADDPAQIAKNEYLWPSEQPTTPETSTPSRIGSTKRGKGGKKARLPKLGTASVSGPVSPVRESPEELRRRRQQDAQDAMDTWFDPASETAQAESNSASQIPLPQAPDIVAEDEAPKEISPPALTQESAPTSMDSDTSSLLLTRKKSKKGKKKQKASSFQGQPYQEEITQEATERGGDGEPPATPFESSGSDVVGYLAADTPGKSPVPVQIADDDVDSTLPGEASTSEVTSIDDAQQDSGEIKAEEPVTRVSKAERKKQKKARKTGLSVEESLESPGDIEQIAESEAPVINEDAGTVTLAPADDTNEAVHSPSPLTQDKRRIPDETPQMPMWGDVMASTKPHALLAEPEQVDLPVGSDDDLDRPSREISDSDFAAVVLPPSHEFTLVKKIPGVNDGQTRSSPEPEAFADSANPATVETPEEESSWFSWLPGGKKKKGKKSKKGSSAPESSAANPTVISQEPFERLSAQTPSAQEDKFDGPVVSDEPISDTVMDDLQVEAGKEIGNDVADPTTKATDEMITTVNQQPSDDPPEPEAFESPGTRDVVELGREHSTAAESDIPADREVPVAIQDTIAEDEWAPVPPKKGKKGKKAKKGTRTSLNENDLSQDGTDDFIPGRTDISTESRSPAYYINDQAIPQSPVDNVSSEIAEPESTNEMFSPTDKTAFHSDDQTPPVVLAEDIVLEPQHVQPETPEDSWLTPIMKKGKKGKKNRKSVNTAETSIPESVEPGLSTLPGLEIPGPDGDRSPAEAVREKVLDDETSSHDEPGVTTMDLLEASSPVLPDVHPSEFQMSTTPTIDDQETTRSTIAEDVSAPEAPAQNEASLDVASIDEPTVSSEQLILRDFSMTEPSIQTAEDEWDVPVSKKKKKKGKKGKLPVVETPSTSDMYSVEPSLDFGINSAEDPESYDAVIAAPEDESKSCLPAEPEAAGEVDPDEIFSTPSEERTETLSFNTREAHFPNDDAGTKSRSVTPTQDNIYGVQDDDGIFVPAEEQAHNSSTCTLSKENQTDVRHRSQESGEEHSPYVSATIESIADQNQVDAARQQHLVETIPSQTEPGGESSSGIVQETFPVPKSCKDHEHQQSSEIDIKVDEPTEESTTEDPQTHHGPTPELEDEEEQIPVKDNVEPEPASWSPEFSKKDKKKKKKASSREGQSGSSPYLALEADDPLENDQLLEQPPAHDLFRNVEFDVETAPTPLQDLEVEPEPVEEIPISKKLSKKEKKKAKKGKASENIISEEALETHIEHSNDSAMREEETEEISTSTTPMAEDFYTPMKSQETEGEPNFAPVKLSKKDKKKAKKKGKSVESGFSEFTLLKTETEQPHSILKHDRELVSAGTEQPGSEEPSFLEETKIKNHPAIEDLPSTQAPEPVEDFVSTHQPASIDVIDIAHDSSTSGEPANVFDEDPSAPESVSNVPLIRDESGIADNSQTAEESSGALFNDDDQSRGIEEPTATEAREIPTADLIAIVDQSTAIANTLTVEQSAFTEQSAILEPYELGLSHTMEESDTRSGDASNVHQSIVANSHTAKSSSRPGDYLLANSLGSTGDHALRSSSAHEEIHSQIPTALEPLFVKSEPPVSERTTSEREPAISGEPLSTDHISVGESLVERSSPDIMDKEDVTTAEEEALTTTQSTTIGDTPDAENKEQHDPLVETRSEAQPDDTFWTPSKMSKKDKKKAKKTKSNTGYWPGDLGAENIQEPRDEDWSQPTVEAARQENKSTDMTIAEPVEAFMTEPTTQPVVDLPVKTSKKAKKKSKKNQVTEEFPWDNIIEETPSTKEGSATRDDFVEDRHQDIAQASEQTRESATEASSAEPMVESTTEPDTMSTSEPTTEPANDEFKEATHEVNNESSPEPINETPAGFTPEVSAESTIESATDRAEPIIESRPEVSPTSHDLSAEDVRETTPLGEYAPSSSAKLCKKDKKKAKNTKATYDYVQADDTREPMVVSQAAVPEVDLTGEKTFLDHSVEQDVPLTDVVPEAEPESEWAMPAKLSKKDKKKAKKAKAFDVPSEAGEIQGQDDQNRVPEKRSTPVIDLPVQSEQIEPVEQGIPPTSFGRTEVTAATEPDPEDEWAQPKKQSKKDKRKKRTTQSGEEQHVPQEYTASDNKGTTEDQVFLPEGSYSAEAPLSPAFDPVEARHPSDRAAVEGSIQSISSPTVQEPDQRINVPEERSVTECSAGQPVETPEPLAETNQIEELSEQVPEQPLVSDDHTSSEQDLDFAATLAAGLQDSGFDPNLVIDDPVFHRRASPPGAGEADPDEISSVTTKSARKQGSRSRDLSPYSVPELGDASTAQEQLTHDMQSDNFSNALAAGLAASGFPSDISSDITSGKKGVADESEEFSFAISKRKKKGKKGRDAAAATPAVTELETNGKEHSPSKEDQFLPADATTQSAVGEKPNRGEVNEPMVTAGKPWTESEEARTVDAQPENERPMHDTIATETEHNILPPVGSTIPRDLLLPSDEIPANSERPTIPASDFQPGVADEHLASGLPTEHVTIVESYDGELPNKWRPRDGPAVIPQIDSKSDAPSNIIAREPEFSVIGKRKNKKDKKSKKIILEGTPDLSGQEPIYGLPATEDLGPAVRSTKLLNATRSANDTPEEGRSLNESADVTPSVGNTTAEIADVAPGPIGQRSTLKRDFGKSSETERPGFFHTSEVSQSLPVAVDDSNRSKIGLVEDVQKSDIGIAGIAAMAAGNDAVAMKHNKNEDTAVPRDLVENSQQNFKTSSSAAEPPTWSFANLDSNVPSPGFDGDDIALDKGSQDTQGTGPNPPISTVPEDTPPSPVESTTKDRTSYLFQSPPVGSDRRQSAMRSLRQQTVPKQTRFEEPTYLEREIERPATPPAPLPPSPSRMKTPPLPPLQLPRQQAASEQSKIDESAYPEQSTERPETPPAPLPPSPSRVRSPPVPLPPSPRRVPTPVAPLPPSPRLTRSTAIARKKSRGANDIASPEPGHSIKNAGRTTTHSEPFGKGSSVEGPASTAFMNETMNDGSPFNEIRDDVSDSGLRMEKRRGLGDLRTASVLSNRSISSNNHQVRSSSAASNHSSTLSLRRIDRSLSGDLRAASRRGETPGPKTIPIEPPPTPPLQEEDGFNGYGNVRTPDMANVYEGWGDVHGSSSISPTRPPSMRKRQSMHILDLEARLEQLASENQQLHDAATTNVPHQYNGNDSATREALEARDLQLQQKDAEIQQIRAMLEPLQHEIARLTEANSGLTEANKNLVADTNDRYATLQNEQAHAHKQWQQSSKELETLRRHHNQLNSGMEDIVRQEIASALEDKNAEIRKLREELDLASQKIRLLQSEILASRTDNYLNPRDEDYFDTVCQKLCQHVQQWVLRFSKFSDNRMCRLTSDLTDDKIEARLDNAILDGSDVDKLLGDRIRRRDVFMSVVMTMIWEYVFTRYLFGMDREQRQKLKSLEKILTEVGPARAVANWRATTLTLLSKRPAFSTQRNLDTEAVTQEIFSTLSALLPPPAQLEAQIMASLRNVLRLAVDLSIEMRTQKAEFIMLPPLQPEYDSQGDLIRKVHFNAALMNERSGEYSSNDELERTQAVVKIVLFPLVVKKGDDVGEGEDEIVVCPAQVLVAGPKNPKKVVRVLSGAMDIDSEARRSKQSLISGLNSENLI